MTELVEQLHTAARAVDHANDRQLVFPGVAIGVDPLVSNRCFRRTTTDGEIIRRHHRAPLFDRAHANDRCTRRGGGNLAFWGVLHRTGQHTEFLEAFAIEQVTNALTGRELALGMMLFHRFRTTQCIGDLSASTDIGEFQ